MSCKDINFNAGFNGCNDKVAILRNSVVQRELDSFDIMTNDDVDINSYIYVDHKVEGKTIPSKMLLSEVIASNATQSDWDEEDDTKLDYIKNKPEVELQEDLISLYNIGGIKLGQVFEKGTSYLDIMKELLSTSRPEVFRFGVVDDLYNFDILSVEEFEIPTSDLIAEGFVHELTFNNNYLALLIPEDSHVDIKAIYQAGYSLGIDKVEGYSMIDDDRVAWKLYTNARKAPITGTFTFDLKFKFAGQE